MIPDHPVTGTAVATSAKVSSAAGVTPASLALAKDIADSSKRRLHPPVRKSFAAARDGSGPTPLAQLVGSGGRGGAVPIKLYLALLWRCSGGVHDTEVSARKWATLLDLPDPNERGARRVASALRTLDELKLVKVTRIHGGPSNIKLLREDGSGSAYSLPSTAYTKAAAAKKAAHLYFKVPVTLWTKGHIQQMSAPALAMLLAILAEEGADGRGVWWSTELFPARYGIASATRAKGTAELTARGLLWVQRHSVAKSPGQHSFVPEAVRSVYHLLGDATTNNFKRPRRPRGRLVKTQP